MINPSNMIDIFSRRTIEQEVNIVLCIYPCLWVIIKYFFNFLSDVLSEKQIVVHLLTTEFYIPIVGSIFSIVHLLSIEAYLAAKILKSRSEDSFSRKQKFNCQ
jgi:hypothetical protein